MRLSKWSEKGERILPFPQNTLVHFLLEYALKRVLLDQNPAHNKV